MGIFLTVNKTMRDKYNISLKDTLKYLACDNRRRRKYLNKKAEGLGFLSGFYSHVMIATMMFRFSHYFFCKNLGLLSRILYVLNIIVFGVDISPMSNIGPGFVMLHLPGIAIHCKAGKNLFLYGQNVIGGKGGESDSGWYGGPVLGNNITMYLGAKITGSVKLEDNIVVGAASLVIDSIPSNKVVVGVPARVIKDVK